MYWMYWRDYCFDSVCEFHRVDKRTARKSHTCGECNREILAGTQYFNIAGKWDGVVSDFKMCLSCDKDWDTVLEVFYDNRDSGGVCVVYGALCEAIGEAFELGYLEEDDPLMQKWFPEITEGTSDAEKDGSQLSFL